MTEYIKDIERDLRAKIGESLKTPRQRELEEIEELVRTQNDEIELLPLNLDSRSLVERFTEYEHHVLLLAREYTIVYKPDSFYKDWDSLLVEWWNDPNIGFGSCWKTAAYKVWIEGKTVEQAWKEMLSKSGYPITITQVRGYLYSAKRRIFKEIDRHSRSYGEVTAQEKEREESLQLY